MRTKVQPKVAGYGLLLAVAVIGAGFYFSGRSESDPGRYGNDFNVYYYAAREIVEGRDPYQNSIGDWTPYLYPPLLAELLVPLSVLPVRPAAYVWFLVSAASLIGGSWLVAKMGTGRAANAETGNGAVEGDAASKERPGHQMLVAAASIAIVFRFALDTFDLGQVNAIVASLVAAHVYLSWRRRPVASALAFALAVSFKLTPLLLVCYHLARGRVRFALQCLGMLALITMLSFSLFGRRATDAFATFVDRTVMNEQGFDFGYDGNQSLRGVTARVKTPMGATDRYVGGVGGEAARRRPSSASTILVGLLLLGVAALATRRAQGEIAAAAPFVCLLVILSPLSWKAHFVVLLLPAAFLILVAWRSALPWSVSLGSVGLVFLLFNVTSPKVIGLRAAEWADAHSLIFAGSMILFAASCLVRAQPPKVEGKNDRRRPVPG